MDVRSLRNCLARWITDCYSVLFYLRRALRSTCHHHYRIYSIDTDAKKLVFSFGKTSTTVPKAKISSSMVHPPTSLGKVCEIAFLNA